MAIIHNQNNYLVHFCFLLHPITSDKIPHKPKAMAFILESACWSTSQKVPNYRSNDCFGCQVMYFNLCQVYPGFKKKNKTQQLCFPAIFLPVTQTTSTSTGSPFLLQRALQQLWFGFCTNAELQPQGFLLVTLS